MKKLLAAILLCTVAGSAQTAKKHSTTAQPTAVSDAYAKSAMHVVSAMGVEDGSTEAAEHIETLLKELKLEANTPTEELLTQLLSLRSALHHLCLRDYSHRLALGMPVKASLYDSGVARDIQCFVAYEVLFKANNSKTDWNDPPTACALPHPL
jgi:hypothetical protein